MRNRILSLLTAAKIKAMVDASVFENSVLDEVVLKRATVSVTVLLVKAARHLRRVTFRATPCKISFNIKSISFSKVLRQVSKASGS